MGDKLNYFNKKNVDEYPEILDWDAFNCINTNAPCDVLKLGMTNLVDRVPAYIKSESGLQDGMLDWLDRRGWIARKIYLTRYNYKGASLDVVSERLLTEMR